MTVHVVCRNCEFEELTNSIGDAEKLKADHEANISHYVVYQEVDADV